MIKELSDLGKKLRSQRVDNEWVHDALKPEPIDIELIITKDGSFQKFNLIEKKQTTAEAITAKKGKARLLLDKSEEVLCYGGEKSKSKHDIFLKKLDEYRNLLELEPVRAFYKSNKEKGLDAALQGYIEAIPEEKNRKGNIGFRIESEGVRIHEKPEVLQAIIEHYETTQNELLTGSSKKCSLCNQSKYPVVDMPHGMVKRVPDGQSSGCALVSYNENAFESYALKGNENASICTNCAKTYVEGLNWLLSSGNEIVTKTKKGKEKKSYRYTNRKNFGSDTAIVFWTRENTDLPEIDQLEAPNPDDVNKLLESVSSGKEQNSRYLEADQFYSCALSGAAARVAVRDWIESSLFDFRKSIARWFKDIAVMEYDSTLKTLTTRYFGLYNLARSSQNVTNDKDVSLSRTAAYLWNAAIKQTAPPLWLLTKVLQRARMDEYGVTAERAALIKLILNRNNKGGGFMVAEKIEDGFKPVAYVCGQIFAKLESIQYAALGDRNAGIRERYFTYAMTSPGAAFGRLFNLHSKHFTKLRNEKPGLAINMDKELQELCKDVDIKNFPATFSLEEQGQFAIGYYHQRQRQFNTSEKK
ncbi:MAG TPA: type I-C CRISPR-associated protein Cas8c/Csd1 [Smithellaceae bacterium]|nr:type I-C CRISPR-associated protein Cas8c/Csd1 [Smithellaceae bacterium]HRY37811.1 type I-C CRISPR-associated protein Cas8c/Csd1 [Smithellaceae bacterium]